MQTTAFRVFYAIVADFVCCHLALFYSKTVFGTPFVCYKAGVVRVCKYEVMTHPNSIINKKKNKKAYNYGKDYWN